MRLTSPRPSRAAASRVIDISPLYNPHTGGWLGVSRHHRGKVWLAKFKADGDLHRLGSAPTPEGAARLVAGLQYRGLVEDGSVPQATDCYRLRSRQGKSECRRRAVR